MRTFDQSEEKAIFDAKLAGQWEGWNVAVAVGGCTKFTGLLETSCNTAARDLLEWVVFGVIFFLKIDKIKSRISSRKKEGEKLYRFEEFLRFLLILT